MDILVCVKQVPGTTKVEIDPNTGTMKRSGVAGKINPYDLFAVETALRLREQAGGTVRCLSMGPPQAAESLWETVWMGADEGILLSDRRFGGADVAATSTALSYGAAVFGGYDLIICGKQTTDGDTAQVGPELAEKLGIDHAANVTRICSLEKDAICVETDMDDCTQKLCLKLPCLLTMDKDCCTPRLPSYLRKKALAKEACVKILSLDDLPGAEEGTVGSKGSLTQVERIFPPERRDDRKQLQGTAGELSEYLYQDLVSRKLL